MISELQTGGLRTDGTEDGRLEYVELYNTQASALNLDGYRLEYLSATHAGSDPPTRILATLTGELVGHSFGLVSSADYLTNALAHFEPAVSQASGLLARSGGHVRIIHAEDSKVIDMVGWGNATNIAPWWQAPEIPAGMSIQRRYADIESGLLSRSFEGPTADSTPGTAPAIGGPSEPPVDPPPTDPIDTPACNGIELSEVLPNASGVDSGKEFIELHNPSLQPIPLQGCSLRLGNDGAVFRLPNEVLLPDAYRAFYDSETHLTLPNATAQTIWLLTTAAQEAVTYANDMADDQSWARFGTHWEATLMPTPNASNQLRMPEPSAVAAARPSAVTAVATCPVGKERNPQTNRCRATSTTGTSVKSCDANQVLNPATNRCRSVLAAASTAKPCAAGQIRSPDTNRCRKASTGGPAKQLAAVKDVPTGSLTKDYRWWLIGIVITGALGYGIYEWRQDIKRALYTIRMALSRSYRIVWRSKKTDKRPGPLENSPDVE